MYGELFEEVANELSSFLKFLTIAVIVLLVLSITLGYFAFRGGKVKSDKPITPKLELVLKGQ